MGGMNWKRPTAIKGTMNHAKTSFSTEIFPGATISVAQYLALLRYISYLYPITLQQQKKTQFQPGIWPRFLACTED
jgi:hypothetical protein